jgi:hypothetical protein
MIPPDDLIANIEAEIAKDVKIARGEDWHAQEERHWPDWIDRQAEAFRNILARHQPVEQWAGHITGKPWLVSRTCKTCCDGDEHSREPIPWPCPDVLDLAAVYAIDLEPQRQQPVAVVQPNQRHRRRGLIRLARIRQTLGSQA